MNGTVHTDGRWVPESEAKMSVVDRGFLCADAVNEVTAVVGGRLIDHRGRAARFARSFAALGIPCPRRGCSTSIARS